MNDAVGVFDSGNGGLSVLAQARALMPAERFIYYGDHLRAPYGTRPVEEIIRLTEAAVDILMRRRVKALLIACNTATSAAALTLRARLRIPVVGMEPALKPASRLRKGGMVLVMATPATLGLPKFESLMRRYGEGAVPVACPGLVEFVERMELTGPALTDCLDGLLAAYPADQVDAVVLGCTHYVFLKDAIRARFPGAHVLDGNYGTARRLRDLLIDGELLRTQGEGSVELLTSGDAALVLPVMRRMLKLAAQFCHEE